MVEVFIYGCTTCGVNKIYVNNLRNLVGEVKVINSANRGLEDHQKYLSLCDKSPIQKYSPIIVINNGEKILELSQWKSLSV